MHMDMVFKETIVLIVNYLNISYYLLGLHSIAIMPVLYEFTEAVSSTYNKLII